MTFPQTAIAFAGIVAGIALLGSERAMSRADALVGRPLLAIPRWMADNAWSLLFALSIGLLTLAFGTALWTAAPLLHKPRPPFREVLLIAAGGEAAWLAFLLAINRIYR